MEELFKGIVVSKLVYVVILAISADTFFGVLRGCKEHKFNSGIGIDGVIRKSGMLGSLVFFILVDKYIPFNFIGFLPAEILQILNIEYIGITEFFALIYIAYESCSIIKNMLLCGIPMPTAVREWSIKFMSIYTTELVDKEVK